MLAPFYECSGVGTTSAAAGTQTAWGTAVAIGTMQGTNRPGQRPWDICVYAQKTFTLENRGTGTNTLHGTVYSRAAFGSAGTQWFQQGVISDVLAGLADRVTVPLTGPAAKDWKVDISSDVSGVAYVVIGQGATASR